MDKVSVIVPVFNVAAYLDQCIQSILNQTYNNLELILVDDGSTDSSLKICEHYANYSSKVKVLYQHNQGSGSARNYGLKVATGNYILFVDGDDFIGKDHIMNLYNYLKKERSDIACSFYYRLDDAGNYSFFIYDNDPEQKRLEGSYTPLEWAKYNDTSLIGQIFEQSVGKLFKRNLFKNIEYPASSLGEDGQTLWKIYLRAKKISYINIGDYCWRIRKSSATHTNRELSYLLNDINQFENKISLYSQIKLAPDFLIYQYLYRLERAADLAQNQGNVKVLNSCYYKAKLIKSLR